MHSKLTVWNIRDIQGAFYQLSAGARALFTPDPYIERLVLERVRRIANHSETIIVMGEELTIGWIENNWESLSLFGGEDHYLILDAQKIKVDVEELLLSDRVDLTDKDVLFCFAKKSELYKKIIKKNAWQVFTVESPPFWKDGELLTMLCDEYKIRLSSEAHQYILQAVPGTIEDFSLLSSQLALLFPKAKEISKEEIRTVISPYKVDQFHLASLLAQRNRVGFLKEVLSLSLGFQMMEELFRMVQFHFLKLIDTSYTKGKTKLSKYDKEILIHSKLWKQEDLERVIFYFKELEIQAREKDPTIRNKLRAALLVNLIKM